jgi:hypothetical protein
MYNTTAEASFRYVMKTCGALTGQPGYASQCIQCEECLEKCPQQIDIPAFLETVAAEMEGPHVVKMEQLVRKIICKSIDA